MQTPTTARALVEAALKKVATVSVDEAARLRDAGALVVDLREAAELGREGSIPGAVHVPRGLLEFQADLTSEYRHRAFTDRDRPCLLYCAAGWRSALAANTLQDLGYTRVSHLGGGFAAWRAQGMPVQAPPAAS